MNNYKNYFVVHDQEVVEPVLLSFGVDQYYTIFQCFFFYVYEFTCGKYPWSTIVC